MIPETPNLSAPTTVMCPSLQGAYKFGVVGGALSSVLFPAYEERLASINVLLRARTFLVFQGEVQKLSNMPPRDVAGLFETVCGSSELKEEYEETNKVKTAAEEKTGVAFGKKKSVAGEVKQVRDEKDEADAFENKQQALRKVQSEHALWQLFHIEADIARTQEALVELRNTRREQEGRAEVVEAERKAKAQAVAQVLLAPLYVYIYY